MSFLELKIPPLALTLLMALLIWVLSSIGPQFDMPQTLRVAVAVSITLAGGLVGLWGIFAFRRAKTTVNPMKPRSTSSLVGSGIYRFTRNPMYVGLLFVLVAWAVYLSSAMPWLGPVAFVFYMQHFQIVPEERALDALFGAEFAIYKAKVPRWF